MTEDEFQDWLSYHESCYPGLKGWIAKNGDRDVQWAWIRALSDVNLADAKAATDAIFRGDVEGKVYNSDIPKTIRRLAREAANKRFQTTKHRPYRVDGEIAYRCHICEDSGAVQVWHTLKMEAVRTRSTKRTPRTMAVRCTCDKARGHWPEMATYDPKQHLIPDTKLLRSEQEQLLRDFITGRQTWNPAEHSYEESIAQSEREFGRPKANLLKAPKPQEKTTAQVLDELEAAE